MPIECSRDLRCHDQQAFHNLDYKVMKHAFDIHNEIGRLPSERIFKDELAHRCRHDSVEAWRDMPIRVSHEDFLKIFYVDLVVDCGAFYELKTADQLTGEHDRQLINYLLLGEQRHGKVINFRNNSVEKRFVSTTLTLDDRRDFELDCQDWTEFDERSGLLRSMVQSLLDDWGAFLELSLYREAIVSILGAEEEVMQPVEVSIHGHLVGLQQMLLLNPTTGLHFSAASKHSRGYEKHLLRLLGHISLQAVQWVNFSGKHVVLKTLKK